MKKTIHEKMDIYLIILLTIYTTILLYLVAPIFSPINLALFITIGNFSLAKPIKSIAVNRLMKSYILFSFGGVTYNLVELAFRGYTHWSMTLLGGLCFLIIGLLNEIIDMSIPSQMLISSIIITILEFIVGYFVNILFELNVWDYSNLPYNFMGQICLLFFNLWFLLSLVGIILDDVVRHLIYDEEKPKYYL